MKINKLSLENFKCFKSLDIEFGKIILLTGANSSGKSSIIYSILGAIQSGEFPFQFSPNGKYIEMGDFQEISFKHDKNKIIKIGLELTNTNRFNVDTFWEIDKMRKLPSLKIIESRSSFYEINIEREKNEYGINSNWIEVNKLENVTVKDLSKEKNN